MTSQSELRQRKNTSTSEEYTSLKEASRNNTSKSVGKGPTVILSLITVLTFSWVAIQLYAYVTGQPVLQVILPSSMTSSDPDQADPNSLFQRFIVKPGKQLGYFQEENEKSAEEVYNVEIDGKKAEIKIGGEAGQDDAEDEPSGLGEEMAMKAAKAAKILLDNEAEGDASEDAELRDDAK